MSSPVKTRLNRPPPGCRGPQLGWLSTSLKHFAQHMDAVWVVLSFVGVLAIFGGGVLVYLRRKRAGQLRFLASCLHSARCRYRYSITAIRRFTFDSMSHIACGALQPLFGDRVDLAGRAANWPWPFVLAAIQSIAHAQMKRRLLVRSPRQCVAELWTALR